MYSEATNGPQVEIFKNTVGNPPSLNQFLAKIAPNPAGPGATANAGGDDSNFVAGASRPLGIKRLPTAANEMSENGRMFKHTAQRGRPRYGEGVGDRRARFDIPKLFRSRGILPRRMLLVDSMLNAGGDARATNDMGVSPSRNKKVAPGCERDIKQQHDVETHGQVGTPALRGKMGVSPSRD